MSTVSILNRRGFQSGSPYMAAVTVNLTILIIYSVICTAIGIRWLELPRAGVFWFLVGGVSSPALSITAYYISLNRFGVAKAVPICMGSSPLFSVLLGTVILGERPPASLYAGTALIIGGIWVITRPKGESRMKWTETIIPLSGGFFWGLAAVIRKIGLEILPLPHVGIVFSTFSALVVLLLTYGFFPKGRRFVRSGRALMFFILAGATLAVTLFFLFSAIRLGEVSRVMAIMGATPMLSVAMAAIFLGDLERITLRTYLGTASIVLGVLLITLLRG